MGGGAPIEPATICRVCGYDVTSLDWDRASYHCPECGAINIPGDHHVAPLHPRNGPGTIVSILIMFWPGIATGVIIGAHAFIDTDWSGVLSVFATILGGVLCLTWPWAGAEIILYNRVHEQRRSRLMPWLPLAAALANVLAAITVARVMFLAW